MGKQKRYFDDLTGTYNRLVKEYNDNKTKTPQQGDTGPVEDKDVDSAFQEQAPEQVNTPQFPISQKSYPGQIPFAEGEEPLTPEPEQTTEPQGQVMSHQVRSLMDILNKNKRIDAFTNPTIPEAQPQTGSPIQGFSSPRPEALNESLEKVAPEFVKRQRAKDEAVYKLGQAIADESRKINPVTGITNQQMINMDRQQKIQENPYLMNQQEATQFYNENQNLAKDMLSTTRKSLKNVPILGQLADMMLYNLQPKDYKYVVADELRAKGKVDEYADYVNNFASSLASLFAIGGGIHEGINSLKVISNLADKSPKIANALSSFLAGTTYGGINSSLQLAEGKIQPKTAVAQSLADGIVWTVFGQVGTKDWMKMVNSGERQIVYDGATNSYKAGIVAKPGQEKTYLAKRLTNWLIDTGMVTGASEITGKVTKAVNESERKDISLSDALQKEFTELDLGKLGIDFAINAIFTGTIPQRYEMPGVPAGTERQVAPEGFKRGELPPPSDLNGQRPITPEPKTPIRPATFEDVTSKPIENKPVAGLTQEETPISLGYELPEKGPEEKPFNLDKMLKTQNIAEATELNKQKQAEEEKSKQFEEGKQRKLQLKQDKEGQDAFAELNRQFLNAKRNGKLFDEREIAKINNGITSKKWKDKLAGLYQQAVDNNKKLQDDFNKKNQLTVENISQHLFNKPIERLTDEEQKQVLDSYNYARVKGKKTISDVGLEKVTPKLKEKKENASTEQSGEQIPELEVRPSVGEGPSLRPINEEPSGTQEKAPETETPQRLSEEEPQVKEEEPKKPEENKPEVIDDEMDNIVKQMLEGLDEGEKPEVKVEPTDNNKASAMRMFGEGKKDTEILTALGLSGKENMDKVREWRKEFKEGEPDRIFEQAKADFDKMLAGSTPEQIKEVKDKGGAGFSAAKFALRYVKPEKDQKLYNKIYNLYFDEFTSGKKPTELSDKEIQERTYNLEHIQSTGIFQHYDEKLLKEGLVKKGKNRTYTLTEKGLDALNKVKPKPEQPENKSEKKQGWESKSLHKQIQESGINEKIQAHPEFESIKDIIDRTYKRTTKKDFSEDHEPADYLMDDFPSVASIQEKIAKDLGLELHQGTYKGRTLIIPEPKTKDEIKQEQKQIEKASDYIENKIEEKVVEPIKEIDQQVKTQLVAKPLTDAQKEANNRLRQQNKLAHEEGRKKFEKAKNQLIDEIEKLQLMLIDKLGKKDVKGDWIMPEAPDNDSDWIKERTGTDLKTALKKLIKDGELKDFPEKGETTKPIDFADTGSGGDNLLRIFGRTIGLNEKVTISIPEDGTFTLYPSLGGLALLKHNAERMSFPRFGMSTGGRVTPPMQKYVEPDMNIDDYEDFKQLEAEYNDAKENYETAKNSKNEKLIKIFEPTYNKLKKLYDKGQDYDWEALKERREAEKLYESEFQDAIKKKININDILAERHLPADFNVKENAISFLKDEIVERYRLLKRFDAVSKGNNLESIRLYETVADIIDNYESNIDDYLESKKQGIEDYIKSNQDVLTVAGGRRSVSGGRKRARQNDAENHLESTRKEIKGLEQNRPEIEKLLGQEPTPKPKQEPEQPQKQAEEKAEEKTTDKLIDTYAKKLAEMNVQDHLDYLKEYNRAIPSEDEIQKAKEKSYNQNLTALNKLKTAIDNKDYQTLANLLHTGNKNYRAYFAEYTGTKLPNTEGKTKETLREFTGHVEEKKEPETKLTKAEAKAKMEQARANSILNVKLNYQGFGVLTRKEFIDKVTAEGWLPETQEVKVIQEPTRARWNRMDGKEQEDFLKRQEEAGTKTVYLVRNPDDRTSYDITKAEYDYAVANKPEKTDLEKSKDALLKTLREEKKHDIVGRDTANDYVYAKYKEFVDSGKYPYLTQVRDFIAEDLPELSLDELDKLGSEVYNASQQLRKDEDKAYIQEMKDKGYEVLTRDMAKELAKQEGKQFEIIIEGEGMLGGKIKKEAQKYNIRVDQDGTPFIQTNRQKRSGFYVPHFTDDKKMFIKSDNLSNKSTEPKETSPSKPEQKKTESVEGNLWNEYKDYIKSTKDVTPKAQDIRDMFEKLVANKEQVIKDIRNSLDTDDRYKRKRSSTKDEIAKNTYDSMLDRFVYFGQESYFVEGVGMGDYAQQHIESIRKAINKFTDESLQEYRDKKKQKIEEKIKQIKNPITLSDFSAAESYRHLTPQEKDRYEDLQALRRREQKDKQKLPDLKKVDTGNLEIIADKDTRDNSDLWVVKIKDRVDREKYIELSTNFKKLGGYWSRFKNGFIFKEDPTAKLAGEQEIAPKEKDTTNLRDVAERQIEKAEEDLNKDRLTNTARRARMAEGAEADAEKRLSIGKTMQNIADGIEGGDIVLLKDLTARTQVEELESALNSAKYNRVRATNEPYEKHNNRPADIEDVRYAKMPEVTMSRTDLLKFIEKFPNARVTKEIERRVYEAENYVKNIKNRNKKIYANAYNNYLILGKPQGKKPIVINKALSPSAIQAVEIALNQIYDRQRDYIDVTDIVQDILNKDASLERLSDRMQNVNRLKRMGIESDVDLRAALREYLTVKDGGNQNIKEKNIKKLERELIGVKIPGYFPTPKDIVADMLNDADIEEGMTVLEPSAGKGNIADMIKESGHDVKVIEYNSRLNDILKTKGHNVIGDDFLEHKEAYDRIVMNPPFENGQDIDHVRHAYELLKPDGKLVALMSGSTFTRSDKKATEFQDWVSELSGEHEMLPDGSFKTSERPTGVSVVKVVLEKPGAEKLMAKTNYTANKWRQPEHFFKMEKAKNDNPYLKDYVVKEISSGYLIKSKDGWLISGYDPIKRNFTLLKKGMEGYEEGKELYRAIKEGRLIPKSKGGIIELASDTGVDTFAHELTHAIQTEISKRDRGLQQDIQKWEDGVIALSEKYLDNVPERKELFVEAYTAYLGWVPELKDIYKLPVEIIERVNKYASASISGQDNLANFMAMSYPESPIYPPDRYTPKGFTFEKGKLELLSAQHEPFAPAFFSKMQQVLDAKLPNSFSSKQAMDIVRSGEIKEAEVKWSGIEDWLLENRDKKLTKEDLNNFLKMSELQVKEIAKDDTGHLSYQEKEELNEITYRYRQDADSVTDAEYDRMIELGERDTIGKQNTKFSQYTLPGGSNYREILFTLPVEKVNLLKDINWTEKKVNYNLSSRGDNSKEQTEWTATINGTEAQIIHLPEKNKYVVDFKTIQNAQFDTLSEAKEYINETANNINDLRFRDLRQTDVFKSSHWEEPNVFVHTRVDDRTVNGKKVLFIEEIQSDWALAGRKEGFKKGIKNLPEGWEIANPEGNIYKLYDTDGNVQRVTSAINYETARNQFLEGLDKEGVPDMPFKTSWHEFVLKNILRKAAEEGYDSIAWTTGEMQAERYDLSKQVDHITSHKYENSRYVDVSLPDKLVSFEIDSNGKILDNKNTVLPDVVGENLADVIGKDITEKILKQTEAQKKYAGNDLKIKPEWTTNLYDKVIPNFLNKYGKKWGAKVGESELGYKEILPDRSDEDRELIPDSELEDVLETKNEKVHTLPITESMKQSVLYEGQPLFKTREQAITDTPEFKKWFGDSKVVDENGEPKIMYHGTPFGKFSTFKGKQFFFSEDKNFAEYYGEDKAIAQGIDNGIEVIPAYLKVEKPFDPQNENDINNLLSTLPDNIEIGFAGTTLSKEEFADRLKGNYTLPPKWTKEQIDNAQFGKVIGPDRDGYNNDLFIGINKNNEVVWIDHYDYDVIKYATQEQRQQLLNGEKIQIDGVKLYSDFYTLDELRNKKAKGEITDNEWVHAVGNRVRRPIKPHTASQEITQLKDQDTWHLLELAHTDIFDKLKSLGYDGIKMTERGKNNIAVFKPTQIKSINNQGTFNPDEPNVMLSARSEEPNQIDFGVGLGQVFTNLIDKIKAAAVTKEFEKQNGIESNPKLKKLYREWLTAPVWFFDKEPQLQKVWDIIDKNLVRNVNEESAILKEKVWKNGKTWRKLADNQKTLFLNALKQYEKELYDAQNNSDPMPYQTFERFADQFTDPKIKDFIENDYRKTIQQAFDYVKDVDRYILINRTPENPFLEDFTNYKGKDKKELTKLFEKAKDSFFKYDPNAESFFENELLKQTKPNELEALNSAWANNRKLREDVAESMVIDKYKEIENKMYFPSSRLGKKYFLSATKISGAPGFMNIKPDTYFTTDDRPQYLEAVKEDLISQGYEVKVGKFADAQEEILKNAISQEDLLDLAMLTGVETDNKVLDRLLKSVLAKGFTRHFIPKKFTPGFQYTVENFETAIDKYIGSVPYFKNRTIGGYELDDHLSYLKEKELLRPGSNNEKYIQDLRNKIENRDETVGQALRAASSVWYLSLRPSYLAQQVVQPINTLMPLLPVIAKELGLKQIEAEKAFVESFLSGIIYYTWKVADKIERLQGKPGLTNNFGLGREFIDVIRRLEMQGVGKPLRSLEIIGEQVDPAKYYSPNPVVESTTTLAKVLGLPGIFVEDFTRAQGIRAFFNLGKKAGLKGDDLVDFISRQIAKSYGPASGRLSKPPGYKVDGSNVTSKGLRTLMESYLTFKNFAFMNYGQWGRTFRAIGKDHLLRPLIYKMGAQAGLGGFKYMMWVSTVLTLLSAVYGMLDIPKDPEEQYESAFKYLNNVVPGLGDALYKGLATITFNVDLSALFSQQAPFVSEDLAFNQDLTDALEGAPIKLAKDLATGIAQQDMTKVAPQGIRNVFKAQEYGEKGINAGRKNLIPKEEVTPDMQLKKQLGFTPLEVSDAYAEERRRSTKSKEVGDIIRNRVDNKIVDLIQNGKNQAAKFEFIKLMNELPKDEVYTDRQKEKIKNVSDFVSQYVLSRLDEPNRTTVREWKDKFLKKYSNPRETSRSLSRDISREITR